MTITLLADAVRVGVAVAAVAFLASGDGSAALKAVLVLVPAVAARAARVPAGFDLLFAAALAVEAVGTGLGTDGWADQGDVASHLVIGLLSAPIVFGLLVRLHVRGAVVTGLGVLTLGAMWELVEWAADGLFGTNYSQGYGDTRSDLIAGAVGAVLGATLVALWLRAANPPAGSHRAAATPEASVVIPTYGRRDGIEEVVRAALADEAAREVIVVVDGCDDGTFEQLGEMARREPRIRPVWQSNAGQAAALQRGIEEARYPVVVMLDDDVRAQPGLITGHAIRHEPARRRLVLGYMPVHEPSTWPERVTARLYSMGYEHQCRRWESDPERVIALLWAGNMSLPRSEALRVPLADAERRLGYLQDRELGLRLMKAGFSAEFDRSLRGTHLYSRSLRQFRRDAKRSGEARLWLHHAHGDVIAAEPINPFEDGPRGPRLVLELGAGPAGLAVVAVLELVAYVLGRLGATRTSARHYGLLWGVLEQRGYRAECRRRRESA